MQIQIFSIPIGGDASILDEMNHFLRANKIIDVKKDLAMMDGNSCWTFCITYMQDGKQADVPYGKQSKVDYKEVLEPEVFERFAALRKVRKQLSEKDAVPAYTIFTDAELAEIAKLEELTLSAVQGLTTVNKKRIEKYGSAIIANQEATADETSGTLDRKDSGA